MTFLKRLRVLPVVLGVVASLAAVGTSLFGDVRTGSGPAKPGDPVRPDGNRLVEELAVTKFSKLPTLTYQLRDGELLFAWQIKPEVAPAAPRARDILILVDTSASQAGRPLQQARHIVTALSNSLTANDRVSIWTVSTPAATRALTNNFVPANSDEVRQVATDLTEVEYGSGATDLQNALNKALGTLAPNRARQQLVLLLGDGESAFKPLTEDDRIAVGHRMDRDDVYFFAVPLGLKVNPQNLHGLAALTGGAVVRVQEDLNSADKRAEFLKRLTAALDAPVVKVEKFKFGDEVGEVYPTRLPPLRADKPTLVIGKLAKPAATAVSLAVTKGFVNSRETTLNLSHALPAPQADHFFLNMMLDQWRDAPHKDAPAMLQSDRALALASTQVKLYRDEFLVQAAWAVTLDRWEDAAKLFQAAQKIDPNDREAAAGLALLEKLRGGKVTRDDLRQKISAKTDALKVTAGGAARAVIQNVNFQDPQPPAGGVSPQIQNALQDAAARRKIEEDRLKVLVEQTIRRARQLLRTAPDEAYADLKRQRDDIASYDGIGATARTQMVADLDAVMREVFLKGAEIKRQAEAEREAIAKTRQRLNEYDRAVDDEKRTKHRIDQFRQLMQQARFEMAYQEAQLMIQERIVRGQAVPTTATASYIIGQQATHLREWKELVRIREDRYLLAMLQSEKSHIPYPDEPPVHFPPAAVWRELTSLRREAYLHSNLGPNPTQAQIQLKSKIENDEVLPIEGDLNNIPLFELLGRLSKQHGVTFVIMEEYFKAEGVNDIKDKKPNLSATQLRGLKLGTFLDIVLLSMNATYIVRPDYIEITTFDRRLEEKVTRVFPVADLAIPIPDSVNQQTLFQNLFFQNQQLAIFGQVLGAANFQGFGNAFGNQNQQFGNQLQGGQPGPFGIGANQFGPIQNQGNQGVGGGGLAVGGGNLGQFGNLGGQFGLQGGDQSSLLMNLIVDTVARGEWLQSQQPGVLPGMDEEAPVLPVKQLNSLGYYPPARALIIRGTSRYHPAATIKLKKQDGMAFNDGNPRDKGPIVIGPGGGTTTPRPKDPVAANPPKPKDPKEPNPAAVANAGPGAKPTMTDPKFDPAVLKPRLSGDPKRRWSEAIAWTVTDPGLIVASAEFLMEMDEYKSAVEVLKGGLRKGLTTDTWAHDALALALQESQAGSAEYERAALSAIDLDPTDSKAYLKAAKVASQMKNHDLAMAFSKRAAEFAPDQPVAYANTLAFAEQALAQAKDVKTDAVVWAAKNLLRRDWTDTDGIDYHAQTKARLDNIINRVSAAGQKTDDLRKVLSEQTQRDLVVELLWQGAADLDLIVAEPSGSVCSPTTRRTTGGGVLKCDILEQTNDRDRSEQYVAALAFKGTYKVTVRQAFGKPIGGTATLKVTKFKGTARESHDLITVDLGSTKPVEIKLDGGSRTELATITDDGDELQLRAATTGAALPSNATGIGGGFGSAGSLLSSPHTTTAPTALPVVNAATETRLPGIGSAADLRASVKVNPDRQTYSVEVKPVFGTTGKDVVLPKVSLLPGAETR
jgi:tetratricopeptide (TPR) repeat protein